MRRICDEVSDLAKIARSHGEWSATHGSPIIEVQRWSEVSVKLAEMAEDYRERECPWRPCGMLVCAEFGDCATARAQRDNDYVPTATAIKELLNAWAGR